MSLSAELDDSGSSRARNRPVEASVPHPAWDAALAAVADGARTRLLTAVIGEAGVGKSLLLAQLHVKLEAAGLSTALVRDSGSDQLAAVDVLLLDSADRLSPDELRMLCAQAPSCVMAGRPEFAGRLADLHEDPAIVLLPPLSPEQTGDFFRALVLRDLGPGAEVRDDAVAAMAQHSEGVPRTVAILAGLAAFAAGLEDAEHILARHVEAAVRLRSGAEDAPDAAPDVAPLRAEPPAPFTAFSIFDPPAEVAAPDPPQVDAAPRPSRGGARAAAACALVASVAVLLVYVRPDPVAQPEPSSAPSAPDLAAPAAEPPAPHVAAWRVAPPEPPLPRAAAAPDLAEAEPPARPPAVAAPQAAAAEADQPSAAQAAETDRPLASAAAPPLAALPVLAAYHVVVTYPGNDRAAERQGRSFAALLASHGVVVDPPRPRAEAAERGVLFYFAEDAGPAEVVANDLDSTARPARRAPARLARDQPLPGTIEVALPLRP